MTGLIPRVIHRVWVGGAPMPAAYAAFWERFVELHDGWDLTTWTDEGDLDWLTNRSIFVRAHSHSERSDVARFELLYKYGGIYVDADVEPLQPFDSLLNSGAFAGWEQPGRLCGAVLGAAPGHPAVGRLVEALPAWVERNDRRSAEVRTGPVYLTKQWQGRPDVTLYHSDAFFPVHWSKREELGGPYPASSMAVHHWGHSWGKP